MDKTKYECKRCGHVLLIKIPNCPNCSSSDGYIKKYNMNKEQIIKRLEQIIEGIEGDRFTIENINQLIKDIK